MHEKKIDDVLKHSSTKIHFSSVFLENLRHGKTTLRQSLGILSLITCNPRRFPITAKLQHPTGIARCRVWRNMLTRIVPYCMNYLLSTKNRYFNF